VSNLLEAEPAAMRQRLTGRPRYALQLLTPASILATLAGRNHIEVEDIGEMGELFLDAKTSAGMISA
jgi:RuvB-like protein 1